MVKKKTKVKDWFVIIAPKMFEEKEIGRTMVADSEALIGRKITMSLVELQNNFEKYYMKFMFRINRVEGNKAFSDFDGSECLRDYISRMVLRRVRRIDTIQDLKTSDGKMVRVKGLVIAPRKIKSSVEKVIRKEVKEIIKEEVAKYTLDDLVESIITDDLKNKILRKVRRIYPVRNFEVRKTQVI